MKKLFALILCVVLLVSLAACNSQENEEQEEQEKQAEQEETIDCLPFDLQFGQSYDKFCDELEKNVITPPEIKPADANDGYLSDFLYLAVDYNFDWSFLHSETLEETVSSGDESLDFFLSNPAITFSFNPEKELYEMYCFFEFDNSDTSFIEPVANEIIAHFNDVFEENQAPDGFSKTLSARWKNEELGIRAYCTTLDDDTTLFLVTFHNFSHDLDHA